MAEEIRTKAREWWQQRLTSPAEVLRTDVLSRFEWHKDQGHDTVLLSGSFGDLIEPLAKALDVNRVISTEPEIQEGIYTGEVRVPMIGEAKLEALQADAKSHQVDLAASYGYGDHPSDLPFLSLLGNPHLVGSPSLDVSAGVVPADPRTAKPSRQLIPES